MQIEVLDIDCIDSNIGCHTRCPLAKALRRQEQFTGKTVQVFTRNDRTWVEVNGKQFMDASADPKVPCIVILKEVL